MKKSSSPLSKCESALHALHMGEWADVVVAEYDGVQIFDDGDGEELIEIPETLKTDGGSGDDGVFTLSS